MEWDDEISRWFQTCYKWIEERERFDDQDNKFILRLYRLLKMKNRILNPLSKGDQYKVSPAISNKIDDDICLSTYSYLFD